MNADFSLPAFLKRSVIHFRTETGRSLGLWVFIALANLLTQMILRRELQPGEFGMFNSALGVIGLMCVPFIALDQAFIWHGIHNQDAAWKEKLEAIRAASLVIMETFTWVWGVISVAFLLLALPLLDFSRFSLHHLILINVLVALGSVLSGVICRIGNRKRLWIGLTIAAVVLRVILAGVLDWYSPWAESGLGAFLIAGIITLIPALRHSGAEEGRLLAALRTVLDRKFLVDLGATFSVFMAIFLFTSGDRIVAQRWFGTPVDNNIGYVNWPMFDAYQSAGLLARSLLWGGQPLLLLFFCARLRLNKSTAASLYWFWIYLGILVGGIILLMLLRTPASWLFCGKDYALTARLLPTLAMAMLPLGLLQALGVFSLASRRYPECFTLGGCSVAYALLLFFAGRQPQLMPAYMFGGGLVALMILLFVGVVRWGRKQP